MAGRHGRRARSVAALLLLGGACSAPARRPGPTQPAWVEPTLSPPGGPPGAAAATTPWTRAEWLAAAEGYLAHPESMPRLGDPASRPLFEELVDPTAWVAVSDDV